MIAQLWRAQNQVSCFWAPVGIPFQGGTTRRQSRRHGMGREQKASPGWAPSSCSEGREEENKPEELCIQKQLFLLHGEVCSLDQNKGSGVLVLPRRSCLAGQDKVRQRRLTKSHLTQADQEQMSFQRSAVPTAATQILSIQMWLLTSSQQACRKPLWGFCALVRNVWPSLREPPAQGRGWDAET